MGTLILIVEYVQHCFQALDIIKTWTCKTKYAANRYRVTDNK